jgi:hypothetical protein
MKVAGASGITEIVGTGRSQLLPACAMGFSN